MDLNEIKKNIRLEEYEISYHAEKERYSEQISIADLETAILNGEILESYPNDPRGSSCLILGYSLEKPIHIICGYASTKRVRIITVYLPKSPKWHDERTRSKKK